MSPIQAVVFDMDGVIVDSEHQWGLCEDSFIKTLVPTWSARDHERIVGLGVVDLYHWLVKEYGIKQTKEDFLFKCDELAEEVYSRRVTLAKGFPEFLKDLESRGVRRGLASSSPRDWIDIVLRRFHLESAFEAVASGDEVPGRTKPAPDLYLLAAERMRLDPGDCLAVEDSGVGVRAAKSAGMRCGGFRNGTNAEQDLSPADFEFDSFGSLASRV